MGSLFLCELCLNKIIAKSITLCHNKIKIGGLYEYGLYLVKKWPERPIRPGLKTMIYYQSFRRGAVLFGCFQKEEYYMDVSTIAKVQGGISGYAKNVKGSEKPKDAENVKGAAAEKHAYDVNLSEEGKAAQAGKTHGDAVKGLTPDQVEMLQDGIQKSYDLMIKTLTAQNTKLQAWLSQGDGKLNFDGVLIDTSRFALPPVGTTPEEAAAAIAPGGEYSVEKVADRIMGLAQAFAGEDPEKLKQMQDAIEEGFRQAGVEFKDATGAKEMPDITKQTHDEITRRFDELYKKIAEANSGIQAAEEEE